MKGPAERVIMVVMVIKMIKMIKMLSSVDRALRVPLTVAVALSAVVAIAREAPAQAWRGVGPGADPFAPGIGRRTLRFSDGYPYSVEPRRYLHFSDGIHSVRPAYSRLRFSDAGWRGAYLPFRSDLGVYRSQPDPEFYNNPFGSRWAIPAPPLVLSAPAAAAVVGAVAAPAPARRTVQVDMPSRVNAPKVSPWTLLANGDTASALGRFAAMTYLTPEDERSRIGFALAAALRGDDGAAAVELRGVVLTEAQLLIDFEASEALRGRLTGLLRRYVEDGGPAGAPTSDVAFLESVVHVLLDDDKAAREALGAARPEDHEAGVLRSVLGIDPAPSVEPASPAPAPDERRPRGQLASAVEI